MEINLCVGNIKISLSLTHSLSFYQLPSDRILWLHCLPQREKEIVCVCVCVCVKTRAGTCLSVCVNASVIIFLSFHLHATMITYLKHFKEERRKSNLSLTHTHFHTHACAHIFTHTFTQRALKKYGRCVP